MANSGFIWLLEAVERGAFLRTRKWGWQRLYNLLSRVWRDKDWRFMNYGFLPDGPPFALKAEDEADRPFIGLYHQAVEGLPVAGSRVLEVGSGRGGGSRFIARYCEPASVIGLDYSAVTVRLAKRLNRDAPGLSFRQGDAERLPFSDGSMDIVINIESSHCYADVVTFAREVARVLAPGGWFTIADMRATTMVADFDRQLAVGGLELKEKRSITAGVVAALDVADARKRERISRMPVMRRFMVEFAGAKGSVLYNGLNSGMVVYLAYRFQKTAVRHDAALPNEAAVP